MHLHARNPALKLVMVPRNDLSSLPVNLNDQYNQAFTKITLDIPLLGSVYEQVHYAKCGRGRGISLSLFYLFSPLILKSKAEGNSSSPTLLACKHRQPSFREENRLPLYQKMFSLERCFFT